MKYMHYTKQYYRLTALRSLMMAVFIAVLLLTVTNSCKTTKALSSKNAIDSSLVFSPGGEYASMRIPALVLTKKGREITGPLRLSRSTQRL